MTKEFFKSEMKRMRDAGDIASNTKLIVPAFMSGTNAENHFFKSEWLVKWWNMLVKYEVTDAELTGSIDLALNMKAHGEINYYPTDDELRRIIERYRGTQAPKDAKPGTLNTQKTAQIKSHMMMIQCIDCGKCHQADFCCWYENGAEVGRQRSEVGRAA